MVDRQPRTALAARLALEAGNAAFVHEGDESELTKVQRVFNLQAEDVGLPPGGEIPAQEPFAVVVGCADARVPIELLFHRGANDLFVLRVAGNVLGDSVIGSIDYALDHLPSVRLLLVLGHGSCGAVQATVDAYLDPAHYLGLAAAMQLRAIVDQIFPPVRLAHAALLEQHGSQVTGLPGFKAALVEASVVTNAALMATALQTHLMQIEQKKIKAAFSVYALDSGHVGVAGLEQTTADDHRLFDPPAGPEAITQLALDVAVSPRVLEMLAK